MRDICVYSFLMKCNPDYVEHHSDSSDFESPQKLPVIASKGGNHRLLNDRYVDTEPEKLNNVFTMLHSAVDNNKRKTELQSYQHHSYKNNKLTKYEATLSPKFKSDKSTGDEFCLYAEKVNTRSVIMNKVLPCVSTIFRRPHNNIKHMSRIQENKTDILKDTTRPCCTYREHQRTSKFHRKHRGYSVQPVYTVEEDVQTSPFQVKNECITDPKENNYFKGNDVDDSLPLETETQSIRNYKYRQFLKRVKDKLEKEIRNEYKECYRANDQQQQSCTSKLHLNLPYQVFASSSRLVKCSSTITDDIVKVPSNSSAFWNFFAQKMKSKFLKQDCECIDPTKPCTPDDCEFLSSPNSPDNLNQIGNANVSSQQTPESSSDSSTSSKKDKVKDYNAPCVICKCRPKKKKKSKTKKATGDDDGDDSKPCQKSHDSITKAISQKYKGEIFCIHNPPCVLINGCLNLPPPKSNVQGNLWPVTENKKSSFVQKCRKIKRSKYKNDNACQYHPPYTDLQQCLPEFQSEKIIQSVCNHDPPCEIVHGCQRTKYDPKLQNSCVHVPMCRKLPECVFIDKHNQNTLCPHNPKCAELPLCSRKYIVLTAKEEIGIQVKPKLKMVCRHEPHCFMIPKCLAQAICGDYIPCGAIPGCIHNPQCENIPACCRKSVKQMVSVPSQYPNACRIV